jgi:hypothetical protein
MMEQASQLLKLLVQLPANDGETVRGAGGALWPKHTRDHKHITEHASQRLELESACTAASNCKTSFGQPEGMLDVVLWPYYLHYRTCSVCKSITQTLLYWWNKCQTENNSSSSSRLCLPATHSVAEGCQLGA